MSYLIRIAIVALLIFGIFSIASSFEGKESIFVENTSEAGILFLNGIFKPDNTFCFTPVQGESYNIALTSDKGRQNIQVSKTDSLNRCKSLDDSRFYPLCATYSYTLPALKEKLKQLKLQMNLLKLY